MKHFHPDPIAARLTPYWPHHPVARYNHAGRTLAFVDTMKKILEVNDYRDLPATLFRLDQEAATIVMAMRK